MNKISRAGRITLWYLLLNLPIIIWYCLQTDFGRYPDNSSHRSAVYFLFIYFFPASLMIFTIHIFCIFMSKIYFNICLLMSLTFGIIGSIAFAIIINTSQDGLAQMALMGLPMIFCLCAIIGFILSGISLGLYSCIRNKNA